MDYFNHEGYAVLALFGAFSALFYAIVELWTNTGVSKDTKILGTTALFIFVVFVFSISVLIYANRKIKENKEDIRRLEANIEEINNKSNE